MRADHVGRAVRAAGAVRARVAAAPAVAGHLWRPLLLLAAAVLALSGPVHAHGDTDAVFYASLVALGLGACAVPLGLLALRADPPTGPQPATVAGTRPDPVPRPAPLEAP